MAGSIADSSHAAQRRRSGASRGYILSALLFLSVLHAVAQMGPAPPQAISANPTSGIGLQRSFQFTFFDPSGASSLYVTRTLINSSLNWARACQVIHYTGSNLVYMGNDDGTRWIGPGKLGTLGTLQNSQCTLDIAGSSAVSTGNSLTLTLALTFSAGFTGQQQIYMLAVNSAGLNSGWQLRGTWIPYLAQPPSAVSANPAAGTGPFQKFRLTYSDPNGSSNLYVTRTMLNGTLNHANGCEIVHYVGTNHVYLVSDNGLYWIGPGTIGSAGTLQNNQCTLDTGASAATSVGDSLTLDLMLEFTSLWVGQQNIYMLAVNKRGTNSGWQTRGTWTTFRHSITQIENAKAGTTLWLLGNPAYHQEIEGYASSVSVNRGGSLSFYVNTVDATYTLQVFRLGWYGGTGGREMTAAVVRQGTQQPAPTIDPVTRLVECNWTDPYVLTIPASPDASDWASGFYVVKLTGSSKKQAWIPFVVRDDMRSSDLLFQSSSATMQAYNDWGASLYGTPVRAAKVSFDRPFSEYNGATQFVYGWEYNMVRFLEREGYDVSYTTDVDTHIRGELLLNHKAFLVVGHDEYWTWEMRNNVEFARDHGVHIGFFGSNTAYWQMRLETNTITGTPNRTLVCYKSAALDPITSDAAKRYLATDKFRLSPINRPEDSLIGIMYDFALGVSGDIVIANASHWVFAGADVSNGSVLRGLLGREVDRMFANPPPGTELLAHSPYVVSGTTHFADMTVYNAPSGATVFAAGSLQWTWGLDDFYHHAVNTTAQQATRNILRRFGAKIR